MIDDGTPANSEIRRFSGAGVFLSRNLMKRVPFEDILDAIHSHDEEAAAKTDDGRTPSLHFHTDHTGRNGVDFHVASDRSNMLVSAFLTNETSGLSEDMQRPSEQSQLY